MQRLTVGEVLQLPDSEMENGRYCRCCGLLPSSARARYMDGMWLFNTGVLYCPECADSNLEWCAFDEKGHPTTMLLDSIAHADVSDLESFMQSLIPLIRLHGRCEQLNNGNWLVASGGSPDGDRIVAALRCNANFWDRYWQGSLRGGLHVFGNEPLEVV